MAYPDRGKVQRSFNGRQTHFRPPPIEQNSKARRVIAPRIQPPDTMHCMMHGATKMKRWGAEFGDAIIKHMGGGSYAGGAAGKKEPAMARA